MARRKPDDKTLQRRVAEWALEAGRRVLPDYSHPKSPRTYTQPQLLACLVLRAYLRQTYRGVVEAIVDSDGLRASLGLDRVPRHTTLEEFASRTDPRLVEAVVAEVLALDGRPVEELAEDSTGLQAGGASADYLSRTGKACGHYVKLSLAIACATLLVVAAVVSRGPTQDVVEARALDWRAAGRCRPRAVYKDAGYDSERATRVLATGVRGQQLHPAGRPRRVRGGPESVAGGDGRAGTDADLLRTKVARRELHQRAQTLDRRPAPGPVGRGPGDRGHAPRAGLPVPPGLSDLLDTPATRPCLLLPLKSGISDLKFPPQ